MNTQINELNKYVSKGGERHVKRKNKYNNFPVAMKHHHRPAGSRGDGDCGGEERWRGGGGSGDDGDGRCVNISSSNTHTLLFSNCQRSSSFVPQVSELNPIYCSSFIHSLLSQVE